MKANTLTTAVFGLGVALFSGFARSAGGNEYDTLQLIPLARYTSSGELTAVGLSAWENGTVHWGFYDADGTRRVNGSFPVFADYQYPFIWDTATAGNPLLEGLDGYLLFALDTDGDGLVSRLDGDNLVANAFLVDLASDDVAYVPTLNGDETDVLSDMINYYWDDGEVDGGITAFPNQECLALNSFAVQPGGDTVIRITGGWSVMTSGSPARAVLFEDPNDDGHPSDAQLLREIPFTTGGSNSSFSVSIPPTKVSGTFFAGVVWENPSGDRFLGEDHDTDAGKSWFGKGMTGVSIDLNNITGSSSLELLSGKTLVINADAVRGDEIDPNHWTSSPLTFLDSSKGKAADDADVINFQYLIDGVANSGDDTRIYLFTTDAMDSTQSMTLYDGDGADKSVSVPLPYDNLNVIDPETLPDVTSGFFGDGFMRWSVPRGKEGGRVDVFGFSIVTSPTFGASQTLLPNYTEYSAQQP